MDLSFEKALFRKCGVNETVVVIKDERAANEIAHNLSVQHVASVFDIYIYIYIWVCPVLEVYDIKFVGYAIRFQ